MTGDFANNPFIVIWETTRACALRCVHCRAEAMPHRDRGELTTEDVDHVGNISPSGFLPTPAGNVRRDDLIGVYRHDPLFMALRDSSRLGERCGRCDWRQRCGGSRARAYALSGDPLGEDPGCVYQPASPE